MEPDTKPIKRSEQLAPLSREHHDGLMFVWKLRQGLRNDTPLGVLRDFCNWYWNNHIKPHFFQEEKILLQYISPDHKQAVQLKKEHTDIRELILIIDREPDAVTVVLLANLLERHIRYEERILFPHLEQTLTPGQLDIIFQQLEEHPLCSAEWKNDFWTKKSKPS
jgi:hemerythrin-like domain-containing protein